MPDLQYDDANFCVKHIVDDAVVANSNPIEGVLRNQPLRTGWERVQCKAIRRFHDAPAVLWIEPAEMSPRRS